MRSTGEVDQIPTWFSHVMYSSALLFRELAALPSALPIFEVTTHSILSSTGSLQPLVSMCNRGNQPSISITRHQNESTTACLVFVTLPSLLAASMYNSPNELYYTSVLALQEVGVLTSSEGPLSPSLFPFHLSHAILFRYS